MATEKTITNLRGPAARIVEVSAESVAWDAPVSVQMTGPDQGRAFHFRIRDGRRGEPGLPGVNAVPADEAVGGYIGAETSAARTATDAVIAEWAEKNTVYATDNGVRAASPSTGALTRTLLQGLIDAISASGGGVLRLPKGEIWYDSPLVPRSNVAIVGAGRGVTKLMCLQSAFYGAHTESDPLVNFHLRDFTATGERFGDTVTWKGYHDQYHIRCSWVNVAFDNWGMTGLGPDYLQDCFFENCTTFNTGRANDGTQPSGNGIGIATGGFGGATENFTMIGCHVRQAKRFGIMIEGGPKNVGGKELASARIIGCSAGACGGAGFLLGGSRHSIYANNYAYDNVGDGILFGTGTITQSTPSWRSIVTGNACHNNGGAGIAYDTTQHAVFGPGAIISDNVCTQNAGGGIAVRLGLSDVDSVQIVDNFLEANPIAGVLLELGSRVFLAGKISGNTFRNNWSAAAAGEDGQLVIRGGTVTGTMISDNLFRHNSAARTSVRAGTALLPTILIGMLVVGNHSPINPLLTTGNATIAAGDLVVRGNTGYGNVGTAQVTVGASPWVYTAGHQPETLYLRGGTITTVVKGGQTILSGGVAAIPLLPGQTATVTYTVAPLAAVDRIQ